MADLRLIRFLETVPLCRGFSLAQLNALANMLRTQLVPAKSVLFREGEPGDAFYFVQEGEVGVYKQTKEARMEQIAVLGPGDPVGHMCLIDGLPRSATCIAESRSMVLRGEKRLFERLFLQGDTLAFRFIDSVTRDLCKRLRATNLRLHALSAGPGGGASRTPPTPTRSTTQVDSVRPFRRIA